MSAGTRVLARPLGSLRSRWRELARGNARGHRHSSPTHPDRGTRCGGGMESPAASRGRPLSAREAAFRRVQLATRWRSSARDRGGFDFRSRGGAWGAGGHLEPPAERGGVADQVALRSGCRHATGSSPLDSVRTSMVARTAPRRGCMPRWPSTPPWSPPGCSWARSTCISCR